MELQGRDHFPLAGDSDAVDEEIQVFLTGTRGAPDADRVLATVLFTDIVGSTERAVEMGDTKWKETIAAHDEQIRLQIGLFHGREIGSRGDGFLATFDGPGRAVRCAQAICNAAQALGLQIRAGLHTGEIELLPKEVAGLAVHIGARVAALAGPGEVWVSSTVKDLVVGSGIEFTATGTHTLKGVPGEWQLYRARSSTA